MAKGIVDGTVTHILRSGGGARIRESWQDREGVEKSRTWTVWAPDGQSVPVRVGDVVTATGNLGVRVSTRDPRFIDTSLQRVRVEVITPVDEGVVHVDVSDITGPSL